MESLRAVLYFTPQQHNHCPVDSPKPEGYLVSQHSCQVIHPCECTAVEEYPIPYVADTTVEFLE